MSQAVGTQIEVGEKDTNVKHSALIPLLEKSPASGLQSLSVHNHFFFKVLNEGTIYSGCSIVRTLLGWHYISCSNVKATGSLKWLQMVYPTGDMNIVNKFHDFWPNRLVAFEKGIHLSFPMLFSVRGVKSKMLHTSYQIFVSWSLFRMAR